jgi:hypothetical protein
MCQAPHGAIVNQTHVAEVVKQSQTGAHLQISDFEQRVNGFDLAWKSRLAHSQPFRLDWSRCAVKSNDHLLLRHCSPMEQLWLQ